MSKTKTNQFPEFLLDIGGKLKYLWVAMSAYNFVDAVGDYMTKEDFNRTAVIYEQNAQSPTTLLIDLSRDDGVAFGYPLFRTTYTAIDNMAVTMGPCLKDKAGFTKELLAAQTQSFSARTEVFNKHFTPEAIACGRESTERLAASYRQNMFLNLGAAVFFIGLSIASQKSNELLRRTFGKDNGPVQPGPR